MNNCPICNKPLKIWYQLGKGEVLACSDILCGHRKKDNKEEKKGINKWI